MKDLSRLLVATGFALALPLTHATTVTVATTADGNGTSPLTLRAAVAAANAATAGNLPYIIQIPPGTYTLSLGELMVGTGVGAGPGNKVSFIGTGTAANTTIAQSDGQHRVFNLDPNSLGGCTFALANLTITGGHDKLDGFGGGGILTGNAGAGSADILNLTNCVITGNSTTGDGGGLGADGGSVTAIGCTFSKNTMAGGTTMAGAGCEFLPQNTGDTFTAINCLFLQNTITANTSGQEVEGAGLALDTDNIRGSIAHITNCVFGSNTVSSSGSPVNQDYGGGGVYVAAGSTVQFFGCTFTNNAANASTGGASGNGGNGGAILAQENVTSLLVLACRFVGNSAATGGGPAIWGHADNSSHITANDDWWGTDSSPATALALHVNTLANWLFFTNTASAPSDLLGAADTLTASFQIDSAGNSVPSSYLMTLTNLPITFGALDGAISGAPATVPVSGTATATFTGNTPGSGNASATVDGVTSIAAIAIEANATTVSSTPASHAYGPAQIVPITIGFNAVVTVTGTPLLALADGGSAKYASGSGSSNLVFNYTVQPGDTSAHLDYASTGALTLNGGTITAGGVTAVLTLPAPAAAGSLGANTTLIIDTTAPSVAFTNQPAAASPTAAPTFGFTDSDGGSGVATVQYQLDGGALASATSPINLSGLADGSHTFTLKVTDLVGNVGTASYTWTVDTTAPVVAFTSKPAAVSGTNFASFAFTVTESGSGVATVKSQLDGGALTAATSPVNLTGLAGGPHTFLLQATDNAGNIGSASYNWTVGSAPTISVPPASLTVGYGSNATFSVTAGGSGPLGFLWYFNGVAIGGATATNYVIPQVTTNNAGNYTVVVSNLVGSVTSSVAVLTFSRTIPATGLASSRNPSGYHDSVFFTATVPADATGGIVFSTPNGPLSTNTVASGGATSLSLLDLPRGTNLITAVYSGDANYFGHTNTLFQAVTNHPPLAGNATYTYIPGTTFPINIRQLLTNHVTDIDGDAFTLLSVGTSTNGVTPTTNATTISFQNANNVNDRFTYVAGDGFGGSATGTIFMLVNPTGAFGPTPPSIVVSHGVASITFDGVPGYSYTVHRSTNDAAGPYQSIWTTNAPAGGLFLFTDNPAPKPVAFYRLSFP